MTTHYSSQSRPELDSDLSIAARGQPSNPIDESVFWSLLQDSARETLRNALGDTILGILAGLKMLQNLGDTEGFTGRLQSVFGASGARTLLFIIAKELYRQLNLPFDPEGSFDYAVFLETARGSFLARRSRND
jgi:hypothetical protein